MVFAITNDNEIGLNGKKYKLTSPLLESYLSPLPGKINFGSDSFDQENILSNWIQKDRRGGILINEMDEAIHSNRVWWTNCIISHDGHLTLPRKATALAAPTTPTPTIVNADFEVDISPTSGFGWTKAAGDWTQSTDQNHGTGTKSWKNTACTTNDRLTQSVAIVRGLTNTFKAWVYCVDGADKVNLNCGGSYGTAVGTTGTWVQATATFASTLASSPTQTFQINVQNAGAGNDIYVDDATVTSSALTVGNPSLMANFNGELYGAFDKVLAKLASGRTGWEPVADMGTTITALVPSLNSRLYIFLGDSTNYYYMSTAEAFTESNSSAAYYGIENSGLLYKMNSTGTFASSADPDGATPTWNNLADVTTDSGKIEGIIRGRDADGNFVVYCPTNASIQIYDATGDKWLLTDIRLPDHPNGGKGAAYWNDAHYFSYGLGVKKYVTGNIASLSEVGLDREGGLPVEYNGEIVKFSADSQYFLAALVSASPTSGNSQSGLYIFTGIAWECWWVSANNNEAMNDVIVSSAESGYAIYWDAGGVVYYIDLPRGIQNVRQLKGTQKFETSGILLSSWFDKGTVAFAGLIKKVTSYSRDVDSDETITIKYRLDHENEDRDTGFTTLVVLNSSGENGAVETLLASGAGLSFDAIQYRLDLARGSTNTNSPDLLALVTSYILKTGAFGNRTWTFTVNIDGELDNQTKQQQYDSLWSAIKSGVLIPLVFRNQDVNETHYVKLSLNNSQTQTGSHYLGQMALLAVEV